MPRLPASVLCLVKSTGSQNVLVNNIKKDNFFKKMAVSRIAEVVRGNGKGKGWSRS